jgi:NADH:ubiquinone oxidoreductase subunit 5 (subunit L)/multisubunit Na+/H+ antiporter MnhA subunit
LLAALWIATGFIFGWNRLEAGEKQTSRAAVWAISVSFLLVLLLDTLVFVHGSPGTIQLLEWLHSEKYRINISFILDYKSLVMGTLVGFISLVVMRFSVNYLHREAGFQRFFMMLSVFTAAMLVISFAGNAVFMFIAWELAGLSSYLLIAYSWQRDVATNNANRAFVTNRIGDAGFIIGITFSFFWLGTVEWEAMSTIITSKIHVGIIMFGFMVAAFAKSAQFPFSAWISRALEGPTPSSAVFYGSLMVHAGVYLLLRLEPLLVQVPSLMLFITIIGAITAFYAYVVGLVQTDVKSSFMFSTLSQVGLMMIWIGLGWFKLALFHLVLHAIWRAYQFLHAPSFLQQVERPARPLPKWLAQNTWLYTAALQRFWLDGISDSLLTKPTRALANEVQIFDERVIDRVTGMPSQANMLSTLSGWEAHQKGKQTPYNQIGQGTGLFGSSLQWLARNFQRVEEGLILKGSGEGLMKAMNFFGKYFELIDDLLSQPRYLLVLIMATFVVVL